MDGKSGSTRKKRKRGMATVVCFGDSNTWGCPPHVRGGPPPDRIAFDRRWPNVMGAHLGPDVRIIEEGLSGRTTVFDDPIEGVHKNGARTLIAAVESHAPMDVFVIMLGTNDFKDQFSNSAFNSARGALTLIQMIKGHYALIERGPEILLITPASISEDAEPAMWGDGFHRCQNHSNYLEQIATRTGCFHFDANSVVRAGFDGIHLDELAHAALGKAAAREMLGILKMMGVR
jgi:lysophospholipase L1-like esterase